MRPGGDDAINPTGTKGDVMLHATRRTILGAAALSLPAIVRAQGKEPIKIGNALPLTGSQAGYGKDFDTGMRMAAKDVNDAGGIAGRPVEILCLDTQADPQLGINAVNRFIGVEKMPMFYISWSAVVKAVAPIANRDKVLALNHGANSPEIAHLGDYVYSTFPLADVDITKLAHYIQHTGQTARGGTLHQQRYRDRCRENLSRHVHRGRWPGRGV